MNCFLFQKCEASKLWIPLALFLLALPKQLSLFSFAYNLFLVTSFFSLLYLLLRAMGKDPLSYLSLASFILSATFLVATPLLFLDSALGFEGVLISGLATIITYYAIVLLTFHFEKHTSFAGGILALLLWYGFYFYLLKATL